MKSDMKTGKTNYGYYYDSDGNRRVSQVKVVPTIGGLWRYDGPDGTRLAIADTAEELVGIIRDRQMDGVTEYYPPIENLELSGEMVTPEIEAIWAAAKITPKI